MGRLIFLLLTVLCQVFYSVAFSQPNPVTVVPFVLNNDHIIIKVRLNGSDPINFLFDTGAGGTLITKHLADSLGFEVSVKRKNVGVSGAHEVGVIKGAKLDVKDMDLGNITLLRTNTSFEEMDNGQKIHGIIGYPMLSKYVIEVDYDNSELKIYNQGSFNDFSSGSALPIRLDLNFPVVVATVETYNGAKIEGNFIVDTGARADIIISNPTVIEFDMAENVGKYYTLRKKIGSSQRRTKLRYGRLKTVDFGGYLFTDTPVILSSDTKGVLSLPQLNGIIGNRLLQYFRVIFDYHNRYLYLEPKEELGSRYVINCSGFDLTFKDGKPFINNIVDRSPADDAGMRNGDQLISIDGNLTNSIPAKEIREAFSHSGTTIKVVIKRNTRHKLTKLSLVNLY